MLTYTQALASLSVGKVLDVATGTGSFISILAASVQDYQEFIGIDASDRGFALAHEELQGKPVRFLTMDATHIHFLDGSFDTVCLSNSLHHLADPQQALSEIQRVLKPGGTLIVNEMYADGQTGPRQSHVLIHHWTASVDRMRGVYHRQTFTRQQIQDLLQDFFPAWNLVFQDVEEPEPDPLEAELVKELEERTHRYDSFLETLPNRAELEAQLVVALQSLHTHGYSGAASLLALGHKPL